MTARNETLSALHAVRSGNGSDVVTPQDVIDELARRGRPYAAPTMCTHIVSRLCADAPDHDAPVYEDLQWVGRGRYRARSS